MAGPFPNPIPSEALYSSPRFKVFSAPLSADINLAKDYGGPSRSIRILQGGTGNLVVTPSTQVDPANPVDETLPVLAGEEHGICAGVIKQTTTSLPLLVKW